MSGAPQRQANGIEAEVAPGAAVYPLSTVPRRYEACFAAPGESLFASRAWFDLLDSAARPPGMVGAVAGLDGHGVLPVWCRMRGGRMRAAAGMTAPYTLVFGPLAAPGADRTALGGALAGIVRRSGVLRLDALDAESPDVGAWLAGLREAGIVVHRFAHFGNWSEAVPVEYDAWLARRPGALRNTIRRRTRRVMGQAGIEVVRGGERLEAAIADFELVYARSWKTPEPYPDFNAACMRRLDAAGVLRLGIVRSAQGPIAAEYWAVSGGTGFLLKLAHDRAAETLSPGTVLTAHMIRTLIEEDGIERLDFGRGDDAYKRLWVTERRQRIGVILIDPRRPLGLAWLGRLGLSHLARRFRRSRQ